MPKKKSLQKFTDIDKLKNVDDVKEFINKSPERASEVLNKLQELLNESYAENLGLEFKITELITKCYSLQNNDVEINFVRNVTYEANHSNITRFIHNHLLEYRSFPIMGNIIDGTKLSRQTIYKHLKDGINSKHNKLVKGANEIMSLNALSKLYLIGIQDSNVTALKHFIQLSGLVNNNTTNVNNYIQINNLKLTNEDFNKLPQQDILEIESIVSKSIKPTDLTIEEIKRIESVLKEKY